MTRPTHAERSRTLLAHSTQGVLGTLGREERLPYTSLVEIAALPNGDPLLLTSELAEHTKNFAQSPRVSLLVAADLGASEPLARERVTAVGTIESAGEPREEIADRYLEVHPHAERYVDFEDFGFHRIAVEKLRFIGGFGTMSWVEEEAFREAIPDPIWPAADSIRDHMNEDHADALVDVGQGLGAIEEATAATLVQIDRYGFDLELETSDGERETIRLAFDEPLESPEEARGAFITLVERARSKEG